MEASHPAADLFFLSLSFVHDHQNLEKLVWDWLSRSDGQNGLETAAADARKTTPPVKSDPNLRRVFVPLDEETMVSKLDDEWLTRH